MERKAAVPKGQFSILVVLAGILVSKRLSSWSRQDTVVSAPTLGLEEQEVEEVLRKHRMVFIGGQHRGGTTLLWTLLRQAPNVSGFNQETACKRRQYFGCERSAFVPCSCMEYEGLFLQSLLPQWDLDGVGVGRYGLDPSTHLTEDSPLVLDMPTRARSRATLFNEWGVLWDFNQSVLLEKSPSNVRISRFIGALWGGVAREVRLVVITRHPLAVALALESFTTTRGHSKGIVTQASPMDEGGGDQSEETRREVPLTLYHRVAHWLSIEETFHADRLVSAAPPSYLFRLEDLGCDPQAELTKLAGWLDLTDSDLSKLSPEVQQDPNDKYAKAYEQRLQTIKGREDHYRLVIDFQDRVRKVHVQEAFEAYDFDQISISQGACVPRFPSEAHLVAEDRQAQENEVTVVRGRDRVAGNNEDMPDEFW